MKKFIYIMMASVSMMLFAAEADAQMGKRVYINGGWQFNGTIANEYVITVVYFFSLSSPSTHWPIVDANTTIAKKYETKNFTNVTIAYCNTVIKLKSS